MALASTPPLPEARLLGWALVALVALVALNPGGATGDLHRAVVVVLLGLVAAAHAWSHRDDAARVPLGARLPSMAAALVGVAALAQLVPLPAGLVEALAPATGGLHAAEAAAEGAGPARAARPLSLEPVATARAAALALAYVVAFVAARSVGRDPRAPSRVALGLGLLGAALALGALAAQATTEDPVWGRRAAWPFVNPNHLATFLAVALGLALGVALAPLPEGEAARSDTLVARATSRRGLAAIAVALLGVGLLRTQSRAGALAAFVVAVVAAALGGRLRPGAVAGVAAVAAVVAAATLGTGSDAARLAERVATTRSDTLGGRAESWSVALRVVRERPWAGGGLATYDDASLAAVDSSRAAPRPGDAHNDYLELAGGVGWPMAGLASALLLAVVLAVAARVRALPDARARSVAAGAVAGVLGALAHAVFDFGLQLPAVALLVCVSLGLAVGAAWPATAQVAPGPRTIARGALAGLLLVVGAALALQAAREERARAAGAAAWKRERRPELQAELARRARARFEEAEGPLASAALAQERSYLEQVAGDPGWAAASLDHARRAVARAPGRAAAQAQLALALLHAAEERAVPDAAAARDEAAARLALAGRLGPTLPGVLLLRGEWALLQLSRTGDPARAREAAALLSEAMRRDPGLRPAVKTLLDERRPVLGAQHESLRRELGL